MSFCRGYTISNETTFVLCENSHEEDGWPLPINVLSYIATHLNQGEPTTYPSINDSLL